MDYTTKYTCSIDTLIGTLNEYGAAVIPGVLTKDECVKFRDDIWSSMNKIYPEFNIEDKSTWKKFYQLLPLHSMLLQHYGLAHLQSVWDIRTHPEVVKVFNYIHKTDDLLSSFDGLSIHLPPEETGRGWYRGNDWMHTDQSVLTKTYCIQGMVNLYPANEGDATLTIAEGSHLRHNDFLKEIGKDKEKDNWIKLNAEEKMLLVRDHKQYCIQAPEGSMILWNSKTFHQGIEPQRKRENQNFRMVVYTCLRPKREFDQKTLKKRRKAFEEKRLTNHWGTHLFGKSPRTYGSPLPVTNQVPDPIIAEDKKKYVF